MPVHLLEITVRPDWQSLSRRMAIQRLRLWRATEAAVAAVTMLARQTDRGGRQLRWLQYLLYQHRRRTAGAWRR